VLGAVWLVARSDVREVRAPSWFMPVALAALWLFELVRFSVI